MAGIDSKSFDQPDETRTPDKTRIDVVRLGDTEVGRFTFAPGWRWSECIKPVAGTDSCQAHHVGAVVSGSMHLKHEDGTEQDIGPGDAYVIEPGHDGWVTSNEPFVAFEFDSSAAATYGKPS
jgi:mannose-6-phosphate isomerase-like protein (cupin superfamily)